MTTDAKPEEGVKKNPSVESEKGLDAFTVQEINYNLQLLDKAVTSLDPRFTLRVLRGLSNLRKKLNANVLTKVIESAYPPGREQSSILSVLGKSPSSMDVDDNTTKTVEVLPEVDVYILLLVTIFLLDQGKGALNVASEFAKEKLGPKLRIYNRRSLDILSAKAWYYYARIMELEDQLVEIRPLLLAALRTATLRHDNETQASLITLLLRNYLLTQSVSQADHLVSKTSFPLSAANSSIARYLYYLGRIRAIQLDYTSAHEHLIGAIRQAPQTALAAGFLQSANKLLVVVELLMGDIPERSTFRQKMLERPLAPYFEIIKAVRIGDLAAFGEVITKYATGFKRDCNYTLISRLRQNVIKTGIRTMSLSYSRISLKDICIRLHLESEESAEYIVAKAIRDGVIEATIDHDKGYMQSKEVLDVYATQEPQITFHERIKFCNQLHDESIKAMRYPLNQHRVELKNAEEAREREKELAKEIEEGDIDEDGDFDI